MVSTLDNLSSSLETAPLRGSRDLWPFSREANDFLSCSPKALSRDSCLSNLLSDVLTMLSNDNIASLISEFLKTNIFLNHFFSIFAFELYFNDSLHYFVYELISKESISSSTRLVKTNMLSIYTFVSFGCVVHIASVYIYIS